MGFTLEGPAIVGDNGLLRVVLDAASGAIRHLENLVTGHVLVDAEDAAPWRMNPQGATGPRFAGIGRGGGRADTIDPAGFVAAVEDDVLTMAWDTTEPGVRLDVRAAFVGGALHLWPRVLIDAHARPPADITYPVLSSPERLGDEDRLAWPAQCGWLVRRPFDAQPFVAPYPEGIADASVQCFAYYEDERGGFSFACHDPHSTWKSFRFGAAEISIGHEAWDLRRGASMDLGYAVVITALTRGDWYEAIDCYREWALTAPWCDRGPNRDRTGWLHGEVGLAIWGTPSSLDWTPWYRFYADAAATPLHICAGWDWPAKRPHTVGEEGWFPAKFHEANLEAWRGHRVTPYMNDIFISPRAERFFEDWEPNLVFPYGTFSFLFFSHVETGWVDGEVATPDPVVTTDIDFYVCPATDALRDLHAWRAVRLAGDYGMDGFCYDISSGNPITGSRCLRAEHGHTPGRGREIIQAYASMNRATREAAGGTFAQGVETIIENIVGSVDFYVSRACAGPMGALESWVLGPEGPAHPDRQCIPFFQAVYHDVGPVHEDGWLTLARDEGDLFFWVAARIYLQWGGLLSLHYAINPPERLPGHESSDVVEWDGATHHFDELPEAHPGKIAFVRELAAARTSFGRDYLCFGKLLRPVPFEVGTVDADYRRRGKSRYRVQGTWPVPEVLHAAWLGEDGRVGLFFVNLRPDDPVKLSIDVDAKALWDVDVSTAIDARTGAEVGLPMELVLEPRRVTLVELS